jgi:hypothetical protein
MEIIPTGGEDRCGMLVYFKTQKTIDIFHGCGNSYVKIYTSHSCSLKFNGRGNPLRSCPEGDCSGCCTLDTLELPKIGDE